jgi:hypothetical protein
LPKNSLTATYMKRALPIICGIAVLYTALAHLHVLHHLVTMHFSDMTRPGFLLSVLVAVIAEILCFIGGALLLLRGK